MSVHHDTAAAAGGRRWNCLLELTGLLLDGKVRLEELEKEYLQVEKPVIDQTTTTTTTFQNVGFLKRSSRLTSNSSVNEDVPRKTIKNENRASSSRNPNNNSPCRPPKKKPGKTRRRIFSLRDHVMTAGSPRVGPALPEEVEKCIVERGARLESVVFLIEKRLYRTDVRGDESRLSVPCLQVRNKFLEAEEVEKLVAEGGFEVSLIQPCLLECRLRFSYWPSNTTYALHVGWNHVWKLKVNVLVEGMVVRLWAFRIRSRLCFVLGKVN